MMYLQTRLAEYSRRYQINIRKKAEKQARQEILDLRFSELNLKTHDITATPPDSPPLSPYFSSQSSSYSTPPKKIPSIVMQSTAVSSPTSPINILPILHSASKPPAPEFSFESTTLDF